MVRNPNWWNDAHETGWERTKAAFRRDWQQTVADLTGRSRGHDLNQTAADTLRQARGEQPLPPPNFPNPPSDEDLERHARFVERQRERVARSEARAAEARAAGGGRAAELERAAEEARHDANYARRMLEVNQVLRWEDVEAPLRYGYGAGMHYDRGYDEHRDDIRRGWNKAWPERSYDVVDPYIRMGFERARRRER